MLKKIANRQIFDRASVTNQLITIICNLRDDKSDLDELMLLVQTQIMIDCHYYSASEYDPILCSSGELNGIMFVAQGCNRCIVGQFSPNGKFLGELSNKQTGSEE